MKKANNFIWKALHVLSWLIFIGLCVETGILLFNFIYSLFRPIAIDYLHLWINLRPVYEHSPLHYALFFSVLIVLYGLKSFVFYLVLLIFKKINLVKPFSEEVARLISKISVFAFLIGITSAIIQTLSVKLQLQQPIYAGDNYRTDSGAFLMMAAILFIIAQLFRKGIDMQNENDLTV